MSARLNHLVAARLVDERGFTVTETAEKLGLDRANLSHMLAGRRRFPTELIPALADVLSVNPYELLGPEDPKAAVAELARLYKLTAADLEAVPA